jgi:hypothetical protein
MPKCCGKLSCRAIIADKVHDFRLSAKPNLARLVRPTHHECKRARRIICPGVTKRLANLQRKPSVVLLTKAARELQKLDFRGTAIRHRKHATWVTRRHPRTSDQAQSHKQTEASANGQHS